MQVVKGENIDNETIELQVKRIRRVWSALAEVSRAIESVVDDMAETLDALELYLIDSGYLAVASLGADNEPIEIGDVVFCTDGGAEPMRVANINYGVTFSVVTCELEDGTNVLMSSRDLTHEMSASYDMGEQNC